MNGKRARQLRKAAGGQEIASERNYGYAAEEKEQKTRAYAVEENDKQKFTGDLVINDKSGERNYKLCPIKSLAEGRRKVKALKKHFKDTRRA